MAEWDVCFRFPCLSLNVDEEIHVLECIILFFSQKENTLATPSLPICTTGKHNLYVKDKNVYQSANVCLFNGWS